MKNKYSKISINIIAVFIIAIIISLIPDYNHDFFGDWHCIGRDHVIGSCDNSQYTGCVYGISDYEAHIPTWHWGYRHWLLFFMGLFLFVVQIFKIIEIINSEEKK